MTSAHATTRRAVSFSFRNIQPIQHRKYGTELAQRRDHCDRQIAKREDHNAISDHRDRATRHALNRTARIAENSSRGPPYHTAQNTANGT